MYVEYLVANIGSGKNIDEIMLGIDGSLFGSLKHYYDAAKKLYDKSQQVKISTLATLLDKKEVDYLLELTNKYINYTDVKGYIKCIKDKDFIERTKDHFKQPLNSVDDVLKIVSSAPNYELDTNFELSEDIANRIIQDLKHKKNDRVKLGIDSIDRVCRGIGRNELIIVSANPSVGKTQLILQVLLSLSKKEPVCFVSLEMTKETAIKRIMPQIIGVKADSFYKGEYTKEEKENLHSYMELPQGFWNEFYIIEPENTTVDGIMLEIKKLESIIKKPVRILCIDYLSKVSGNESAYSEEMREYKNAAQLKNICKQKDKSIFLINSMNKTGEISGLKKLEHEADQMWLIKRDINNELELLRKETTISITKNRNSIVGEKAEMFYNTDYLRFD